MIVEFKSPNLYVFKRDINNNRVVEKIPVNDFPPYFYIPKDSDIPNDNRILRVEDTSKKSLFGEELKKVIIKEVYDVPRLRNLWYNTFEADIKFVDRYFIDRIKEIPEERLRCGYFDLETTDMPSSQMDNCPITCIGIYDNYTTKYYTFIISGKDEIEERDGHKIFHCIDEYMVLNKFINHVQVFDYDLLTAHNLENFDGPVLLGRIQKLSIPNYNRLSPIGIVKKENYFGEWKCKIAGRILFDFLGKRTKFGVKGGIKFLLDGRDIIIKDKEGNDKIIRIKQYNLKYLAQFVGMEKGKYSKSLSIEEMIKYNKQDIAIMVALDKHFNVVNSYYNMSRVIGCSFENTYFNTLIIDAFLLKRYNQFVFPTKPERGKFDNDETIVGADVTTPKRGLYKKIDVLDQTSLYPTLIFSFNMSPETLDINGDIIVGNGIKFNSSKIGIIPDAVKFLLEIRLKYKELAKTETDSQKAQIYDLLSNSYKMILVSMYGNMLYKGSRLYQHQVAESITYAGRMIKTEHVKPICESNGYEIVFGDTDASALNIIKEDATPINELVNIINKSFDTYALSHGIKNHLLKIELDKTYSPIIVSDMKKRYCGFLLKNGKKIYKSVGFESVRRDASPILEIAQEHIFKMILDNKIRKDIESYIKELSEDIKNKKYPLEMLLLPKGFSKAFDKFKVQSPWVKAAQYSNQYLGTHFDEFSELGIFYIKSVPEGKQQTDIVAVNEETLDILNGYEINWDIQLDKLLYSKVQNIYDMMGWPDPKQKTLGEF